MPRGNIFAFAWSPDGKCIACAAGFHVRLFEASKLELVGVLVGHTSIVRSVVWSPDGRRLATAGFDGTIRLWRSEGATEAILAVGSPVWGVAWSPDGSGWPRRIVAGRCGSGTLGEGLDQSWKDIEGSSDACPGALTGGGWLPWERTRRCDCGSPTGRRTAFWRARTAGV